MIKKDARTLFSDRNYKEIDKENFPPAMHKLGYDWETDENWFQ